MENIIINLFATLGLFTVIAILLYRFLNANEESKLKEKKEIELMENSHECRDLGYSNNLNFNEMLSRPNLNKELRQLIKDPKIRNVALKSVVEKKAVKQSEEQGYINKRKIGYKYENEIFEVFDTYYKLTQDEIVESFLNKFSTNRTKATEIFQECLNNWLITRVNTIIKTDEVFYSVGLILDYDKFKLTHTDITRDEWLKKNNKKLEHRVNLENDLPF